MHKLRRRFNVISAVACAGVLLLAGCSSTPDAVPEASPSVSPNAEGAAPLADPALEITYELEGKSTTVRAALGTSGCSSHAFSAMSADGHSASAIFAVTDEGSSGQVQASILGDSLVSFQGTGTPVFDDAVEGTRSASVVELSGTATVVKIAEGASPSIGEVDLSSGAEAPATLTATLECKSGSSNDE